MTTTIPACLVCALLSAGEPEYHLQVTPARRVEAWLTCRIDAPALSAREWIIFAAKPPKLPGQTEIRAELLPSGRSSLELSSQRRPILWARLPVRSSNRQSGLTIRAKYRATLLARRLIAGEPTPAASRAPPLTPREQRNATSQTPLIDTDSPALVRWLDEHQLRRREDEGAISFARRTYLFVKQNFSYVYEPEMDRSASHVCAAGKSDCAGLSALFAAVLRAGRVPARLLVGRMVKSDPHWRVPQEVRRSGKHVRAEFFVAEVGWVPVDIATAVGDRLPGSLAHFGNDPGDMLVLHVNDKLILNTVHFGRKPVESLQGVSYWVLSKGTPEDVKLHEGWQVRNLPLEPADEENGD